MSVKIRFEKPYYRWLFGGMGFHNSEATMTPLATEEFMNQCILKTFHEIRPSFSRVFGGFHDWTKEAMDNFVDYYEKTFAKSDTAIYMVPGRASLHENEEQMKMFVCDTTDRLEYLTKDKKLKLIQFFCVTNELSIGNTYAMLARDLEKFKAYHKMFWNEFNRRKLDIGLIATDGSGINEFTEQLQWAADNMDEYTKYYCGHNYSISESWEKGDYAFDDPEFYAYLYKSFDKVVQMSKNKQKRFMLAEFGIHGREVYFPPVKSSVMVSDIPSGFNNAESESKYALMACVEELAALNAGVLSTAFWTFCDYPDPFLGWNGHSRGAELRYQVGKFSGFGTELRYNKHGMFEWSDTAECRSRSYLYSIGLMAKFFRSNSTVLRSISNSRDVICGGVTNRDDSVSLCIINLSDNVNDVDITTEFNLNNEYRMYEYVCGSVPDNKFGDIQGFELIESDKNGNIGLSVKPHSMILLTTDYIDRKPHQVNNISISENYISWDDVNDEYHAYYRVFKNGKQIASTVSNKVYVEVDKYADYSVKSVDRFGNI